MDRRSWPVFTTATNAFLCQSRGPPTTLLSRAEGKNYDTLVSKVLDPLGGINSLVKKGERVVIKPNIAWDRTPEQGANTHPEVVKRLVSLCLEAGASKVMVFDRSVNEERRCYVNSGIKTAVESIGDHRVSCPYIDQRKFTPVKIDKGKSITEWEFYKDALKPIVILMSRWPNNMVRPDCPWVSKILWGSSVEEEV